MISDIFERCCELRITNCQNFENIYEFPAKGERVNLKPFKGIQ